MISVSRNWKGWGSPDEKSDGRFTAPRRRITRAPNWPAEVKADHVFLRKNKGRSGPESPGRGTPGLNLGKAGSARPEPLPFG